MQYYKKPKSKKRTRTTYGYLVIKHWQGDSEDHLFKKYRDAIGFMRKVVHSKYIDVGYDSVEIFKVDYNKPYGY